MWLSAILNTIGRCSDRPDVLGDWAAVRGYQWVPSYTKLGRLVELPDKISEGEQGLLPTLLHCLHQLLLPLVSKLYPAG